MVARSTIHRSHDIHSIFYMEYSHSIEKYISEIHVVHAVSHLCSWIYDVLRIFEPKAETRGIMLRTDTKWNPLSL